MNKTIKFFVNKKDTEKRVDIFLSKKIKDFTRSYIKKLIEKKNIRINNKVELSPSVKIKFKYKKNLSNINGKLRPGIVHRIDKETSGLLVVAKNNFSHSNLGSQFSTHTIKRKYQCLIWGVIRPLNGRIETLISRNKKNRQLMSVSEIRGKKAITNYRTIKVFNFKDIPKISLIECSLETGRTHQIRVHMKFKGTSILGDEQYGGKNLKFKKINKNFIENLNEIKGQILHAKTLEFIHPTKKKIVSFKSNLPDDFKKMLNFLSNLNS